MDIQTGLVCLTVVVISAAVIYLISISTMKEQTYDEAMAELRKKTEEQFSHGRTAKEKLKDKKDKKKAGKKVKEKNGNATEQSETDGGSKGHVAFVEPEVAAVVDEKTTVEEKKKPKKKEKPILLNKNEPSVVIEKQLTTIPVVQNHFEQIHPKDDFELKRSHSREEIKTLSNTVSNVTSVPNAQTKEHNIGQGQKQKQSNKNNNPSVLTNNNINSASNKQNAERKAEKNQNSQTKQQKGNDKNSSAKSDKVNNNAPVINNNNTNASVEKKESVALKSVNVKQQEQVVAATVVSTTNSSPAPTPPPTVPVQQQHVEKLTASPSMKLSKKKKSELAALNQISGDNDGVNVNLLLPLVHKAVLSKSEVQILINSLLNKQLGISDGSSEWIEGRQDPVVKLKKQLAEKEKALADEAEATTGLQARLKEIRAELNSEKHTVRTLEEAIHARQSEMSSFALKLQHTVEEKQALAQQIQQLQTKLTEEHLLVRKLQEEGGQAQNAFQQELLKQRQQLEMHIARLSETQHQQQETIATLEAQLSNQMQEREALTGELSMLQERSAHLQDSAVQSQDLLIQIETIQSERTNIEQHLQQAQMEATHYLSKTSEMKDQLTHVRTENDKLNGLIQSLQNDNSLLRENNDRLTMQVSSAYVEARQLRDENESLAAQVTASMERPATEGRENGDANNYSENKISSHIDDNADNIQKKELLLEELGNQLKAKEIQVENLTSEVNSYKTEISEQQRLANGLREQISKHQKEADRLSNDLTQHKSQVAKLLEQLDSQTLKNNDLRSKNWKVMEALSSTEKLLQNKMNESDKLVAEAVKTATEKALLEQQSSTRQLLQRVFPELVIPECKVQLDWYEQVEKVLRNWKPQQSEEEQSSSDLEKQNRQLHAMVVHYKNIIADTEGMLNRLQSHVEQEEGKWGEELQALQSQLEAVTRERDALQAGCSSESTVDRASNGINHVDDGCGNE